MLNLLHGNLLAMLLLALILGLWNTYVAIQLIRHPLARSKTENHPAWKHMYLIYISYCLGMIICYSI